MFCKFQEPKALSTAFCDIAFQEFILYNESKNLLAIRPLISMLLPETYFDVLLAMTKQNLKNGKIIHM